MEIREAVEDASDSQSLTEIQIQVWHVSRNLANKIKWNNGAWVFFYVLYSVYSCVYVIPFQIQEKFTHWAKCFAIAYQHQNFEEAKSSIQRMTYYDRVNKEIVKKL